MLRIQRNRSRNKTHSDRWKNNLMNGRRCSTSVNITGRFFRIVYARLLAAAHAHTPWRQGHFRCECQGKLVDAMHEFNINMDAHCRWSESPMWFLIGRCFVKFVGQNHRLAANQWRENLQLKLAMRRGNYMPIIAQHGAWKKWWTDSRHSINFVFRKSAFNDVARKFRFHDSIWREYIYVDSPALECLPIDYSDEISSHIGDGQSHCHHYEHNRMILFLVKMPTHIMGYLQLTILLRISDYT